MKSKEFSFRSRANSFRYAWEGISGFFAREHNAWIHLISTVFVIMAGYCLQVSRSETILLVIVVGLVWVSEVFNTAIERLVDFIEPGFHPTVKLIKDLSAAAVLISAIIAVVTGAFIFIPKII